ncbi:PREDICTED: protocadherin gamma-A4-like [Acropora digitifera]|uniref:protocadherin gamma-A4-like n=1 Tax=Acropora digitifera TaxID=70779 RepID=UPI00077AD4A2|nr:PREDICTED: protocadherin gamma-A4-like [Acropora digitifera]
MPLQQFNCVATDGGPFKVANSSTLVVSVNSLDYEKVDMYTVKVTCTELVPNPFSVSSLFFVHVVDVNEAPCNLSLSSQTIPENIPSGAEVGLFSVHDPDLQVRQC